MTELSSTANVTPVITAMSDSNLAVVVVLAYCCSRDYP